MTDFINMGGHGLYIWLSYGLAASAFLMLFLQTRRALKRTNRQIEELRPKRPVKSSNINSQKKAEQKPKSSAAIMKGKNSDNETS